MGSAGCGDSDVRGISHLLPLELEWIHTLLPKLKPLSSKFLRSQRLTLSGGLDLQLLAASEIVFTLHVGTPCLNPSKNPLFWAGKMAPRV